jgi:4-hydroxybenzoate polyprenyltransferase
VSNWKLFRLSLTNHPGLALGWMWPALLAAGMASRPEMPPTIFWLAVFPAVSALPWIPILCTAWSGRKQYEAAQ